MATLRELGSGDFARVIALRNDVIASLSDPDLYVREKDESAFVMSHLGERGITLGIELGNNLIGYSALTLDIERAALEPELALAIREDTSAANGSIDRCGLLAVTMIRPPFQGGDLHNAAIASCVRIAREHGKRTLVAMARLPTRQASVISRDGVSALMTYWTLRTVESDSCYIPPSSLKWTSSGTRPHTHYLSPRLIHTGACWRKDSLVMRSSSKETNPFCGSHAD